MALKQILKRSGDAFAGLFKSADSKVIKTTSKTLGSKATVISGGKVIAKSTASGFSQGVSSTARVGGKVIAGTGIVAIPAAAGIYGLDKFKNTLARQDEYYATKDENKNYSQETDNLKDRIKILEKAKEQGIDAPDYYLEGGSTTPEGMESKSKLSPYALLAAGVAIVAIGAYAYSNKSRGGKK
jgi:hypothetical protein